VAQKKAGGKGDKRESQGGVTRKEIEQIKNSRRRVVGFRG
jgi:hypothetical protein